MGAVTKPITNENLLDIMQDLMQMTSDGFGQLNGRMDGLDGRMGRLEGSMTKMEDRLGQIEQTLREHGRELSRLADEIRRLSSNHEAYMNDIADILDRLVALEKKLSLLSPREIKECNNFYRR